MPKYAINVTLTAYLNDIPAANETHARDIAHTETLNGLLNVWKNGLVDEEVQYQITETEVYSVSEEPYRKD